MRTPKALTIAGSDSGGGAGIQADLKTFAALGVHGMSVVTSVTAQNTSEVRAIFNLPADIILKQIRAVVEDIGVDACKIGMLSTVEIIKTVSEELRKHSFPLVLDPVMVSTSGARLLQEGAEEILKKDLIPLAAVVTPNRHEAEALAGISIENLDDAEKAAEMIADLGPKAVLVKGGHMPSSEGSVDLLYSEGAFRTYASPFMEKKRLHGAGCVLSSAIAAEMAKGRGIEEAVESAKKFVTNAIAFGSPVGKGALPVNPLGWMIDEADRFHVLEDIRAAIELLESSPNAFKLVPELQMNIAVAVPNPRDRNDIAAVPGRMVKIGNKVKPSSCPQFGASRHLASTILTVMEHDAEARAAMNIRYSEEAVEACRKLGFAVSSYDRGEEPEEVKKTEGGSLPWGTRTAIRKAGMVPDIIYHLGDWGKEPMITVLGRTAREVASKALKIAEHVKA